MFSCQLKFSIIIQFSKDKTRKYLGLHSGTGFVLMKLGNDSVTDSLRKTEMEAFSATSSDIDGSLIIHPDGGKPKMNSVELRSTKMSVNCSFRLCSDECKQQKQNAEGRTCK